jgi:hypothetical protein
MSKTENVVGAMAERRFERATLSPHQNTASSISTDFRIMELELENSRLQRLVAELLLKNQQLRKAEEQAASAIDLSPANLVFAS